MSESVKARSGQHQTLTPIEQRRDDRPRGLPRTTRQPRHDQGVTQAALAERVGIHVAQILRYEQGAAEPILDVIRRLTTALNTNADQLIFDNTESEATNGEWHLRLEAITHLDPDEQNAIRTVIDGILLRHQARKLAS